MCITIGNQKVKAQDFPADSLVYRSDSIQSDTIVNDTLSLNKEKPKKDLLTEPVEYSSNDSIILAGSDVSFYKEGKVNYGDLELKADFIRFDMDIKELYAEGMIDTSGQIAGEPVFKQGDEEFQSKSMRYNFQSKKTFVKNIITEEEDGFLHSESTKRLPDGEIHVKNGKYTTCDAEHPHFYVGLTKAIVVPNEKIISGPAYMVIADIPLPLVIPFGFFPNSSQKAMSGFLIPSYGEESSRGYYLRNGGFYWAINDYVDAKITADVYSRGSWGMQLATSYKKRYKFSGSFNGSYYLNKTGEEGINLTNKRDYKIQWTHRQDAKANPNSTFSASVNYSTTSYDKNQSYSLSERLTNTKSSSVSYQKSWPNSPFSLSASMNHSQNSNTDAVNMTVPNLNLTMSRIYPFRRENSTGETKWYENIQLSYTSKLENSIEATDSTIFQSKFKDFEKGYQHSIPLSINFKLFKLFNLTPSLNYKGMLYTDYVNKYYDPDLIADGDTGIIVTDTIQGLRYAHGWSTSFGTSISPKIYGMYHFDKGRLSAIRHVITPTASFSYTPNMNSIAPYYYRTVRNIKTGEVYYDEDGDTEEYSIFENGIYGTPSANGQSGSISLSLKNNIEAKIFAKNDTTGKPEKVSILDNLNFSTSYNPFKKQNKWSTVSMSSSTSIFKKKVSLQLNGTMDPYAYDTTNSRRSYGFELVENGKLFRLTSLTGTVGFTLKSQQGNNQNNQSGETSGEQMNELDPNNLNNTANYGTLTPSVNFDIPWSLRATYNFRYSKPALKSSVTQTLRMTGDFSLTPKWKISYSSGYDFKAKEITATSLTIHRDLHCWEMSLSTIPFGSNTYFEFNIHVKSTILQDLKYDKRWDKRYDY